MGSIEVERATEVEFDHSSGEWIAFHLASNTIIGRGPSRSDVIAQEVAWLEANYLRSTSEAQN